MELMNNIISIKEINRVRNLINVIAPKQGETFCQTNCKKWSQLIDIMLALFHFKSEDDGRISQPG